MISWLKGQIIESWRISSKRGVVLNVSGIGYEIQLLSKQIEMVDKSSLKEFWIHQINREDTTNLYGFLELDQRDLFRKIIGITGIGPQIGMALLDEFEVSQIVDAIERNDLNLLTTSQGIGKRIAERLVVELKNKLNQFKNSKDTTNNKLKILSTNYEEYIEEIKSILNSLGYMEDEIEHSIKFLTTNEKKYSSQINSLTKEEKAAQMDLHLKEILIRLSKMST